MKSTSDIKTMFSNAFAQLQCEMTFSHLMQLIMILKTPPSRALAGKFGLQITGEYLSTTMTFKDGKVTPIEESHVQFDADYFSKHKTAPLQREDFPKNIHCPFAHVRYKILLDLWNEYSPKVFLTTRSRRKSSWLISCRRSTWIASTRARSARATTLSRTRTLPSLYPASRLPQRPGRH